MSKLIIILFLLVHGIGLATNPIIPNKGANDPHIRIIDGKAYLSASHDKSAENKGFCMEDWWLWSSDDLVNWKLEYTLKPEETYIGEPFNQCWATDIVKRNGKFYWYFSEANKQTGVMVADSPSGPWKDPLGKPLLSSEMTPTHEYDMGIVQDEAGEYYIVFGVWDYYIAKLNEDMISLAEKPRKIEINNPRGPYNLDGKNTEKPTDDKPFIHFYNGKFYLSWGCFYAMADNVYGPYDYKGSIIEKESFAPGYDAPTWPTGFKQGRHGSFFEWHNQTYFAYCDISQTGNRYFRDTFISYVHYKKNGEIALIRVDGIGVGEYDANNAIQAEDYYKASGIEKKANEASGFSVSGFENGDYLIFNNINGLKEKTIIEFVYSSLNGATIEIRENNPDGKLISSCVLKAGENATQAFDFKVSEDSINLCIVLKGKENDQFKLDAFSFLPKKITLSNFTDLSIKKRDIAIKDAQVLADYNRLLKKADTILGSGPFTVVNKTGVPPSNDRHDYMSIGPYWWPNPDTNDGLPYIRKDGEINPETRNNHTDYVEKSNFFDAVDVLGKAFYFSGKDEYAKKAVELLKVWFLDEETKMNPNLNFGQGIPGTTDGRPFGIIEFEGIHDVISCLEILEEANKLDGELKIGMQKWLADYANWLQTSELGKMEGTRLNNHGTWYDVQLCGILVYLGKTEQIKEILEKVKTVRIAGQIEPDGSQPHELARTKSFSYSTMNLSAFTALAKFGQKVGVDLWNFETSDGRSIRKAYEYLIPYVFNKKDWKYKQITNIDEAKNKFIKMLKSTASAFEDDALLEIIKNKQNNDPKVTEEILIDSVWVANKVSFALQTVGNKQFVAYYDKNRMMTVASREIGSSIWQKTTLPNKLHWDSHNYVAMGIDKLGYIHVSGNMHVNPLAYFRSEKPYDISTMLELNKMTGVNEQSVTYPKFFYNQEGDLLFSYRSGTCGNGNILVKRFLPETKEWEVYLKEPLFEGVEANDDRAAYHQFVKDSEGNFHFLWIWRWTPMVETSHQICYATTPDLKQWKNAAGEEVHLPFYPDDEKLIVDPTPTKGGMSNARYRIILTPDEKPLAGYVKYDEMGLTQFYLAHFKNGKWVSKQISDWNFRWKFIEGGDQMSSGGVFNFIGFSEDGLLGVNWSTETGKSGRYVINPETLELLDTKAQFKPKYPTVIHERITNNKKMSVNIQDDRASNSDSQIKYVLKWESMGKSHGRHAPEVIPEGPVSPLKLIAYE